MGRAERGRWAEGGEPAGPGAGGSNWAAERKGGGLGPGEVVGCGEVRGRGFGLDGWVWAGLRVWVLFPFLFFSNTLKLN